jgi:isopenicillin-N epimerase
MVGRARVTSPYAHYWSIDPAVSFLNHGSFGATPTAVSAFRDELRDHMERQLVRFFMRDVSQLWAEQLERAAAFVGADPDGLAFVTNATTGVNTVLASLDLRSGDELLVTDHEYNACRNALNRAAERADATVRVIELALPITSPDEVVAAVASAITERTRLLLIDHVTSQTGFVVPIADIARVCRDRGVEILVDGAHAPGMLDLDVDALGVDYYTGNFHKWVCTPKTVAILWVAQQHRARVKPLTTSHGANMHADDAVSAFRNEFDWVGTVDPTPVLSTGFTIDHMASMIDGGWPAIRQHNRELALTGRDILNEALGETPLVPDSMIGSLAAVRLPDRTEDLPTSIFDPDPDQTTLLLDHGIEVPIIPWPEPGKRLLRISTQLYNSVEEIHRLAALLKGIL